MTWKERLVSDSFLGGSLFSILGLALFIAVSGCNRNHASNNAATTGSSPASTQQPHQSSSSSNASGSSNKQSPSLTDMIKALQGGDQTAGQDSGGNQLPSWKPISAAERAQAPAHIPLEKGLIVTTAISGDNNDDDYESNKAIDREDASTIHLQYSASVPEHQFSQLGAHESGNERMGPDPTRSPDEQGPADKIHHVHCARTIDRADLVTAHAYSEYFCASPEEHFPGTTAISGSRDLLQQLHAGQQVNFHYSSQNILEGLAALGAKLTGDKSADVPDITIIGGQQMHTCTLHQVEPQDLAFPVLFNDQRIIVPALHAMCKERNQEDHIYYLDDPDNPITLAFQLGPASMRLQVIKIELVPQAPNTSGKAPTAQGSGSGAGGGGGGQQKQMEQELADKKKVEIYGIYFDFNSAVVRPDSEATLVMIADIMQRNPTWKLAVSGHTDNIGGDDFNQQLSQRRAEAVKSALVTRFYIAPDRLTTAGYGASRPIESNATLEGRARNRRVELERQ